MTSHIADRVAALRQRAGLSQTALAEAMREAGQTHWRQNTVSRVEAGKQELQFREVRELEDIIGELTDREPSVRDDALFLRAGGEPDQARVEWHREHREDCLVTQPISLRLEGEPIRAWQDPWIRCALDFSCPTCGVDIGTSCRSSGVDDVAPHKRRKNVARSAPWPT